MTIRIRRLAHQATALEATIWLKDVAAALGLGFHPDTHGKNYRDHDGHRVLDDEDARNLDHGMLVCNGLIDTYAVTEEALAPVLANALYVLGCSVKEQEEVRWRIGREINCQQARRGAFRGGEDEASAGPRKGGE